MKITAILEIPWIWRLFRKIIDILFGLYRKRMKVIRNFGLTSQASVIDIACGTGEYSKITSGRYLGIDMDCHYITDAQKRYGKENKKFICQDANKVGIPDDEFETAILIDATHHLSDEENLRLFKTMSRVASKMVIICDPVQQSRGNLLGQFLTSLDRGNYIRPKEKLLELIKSHLSVERVAEMKLMGVEGICVLARPKK